jgi:hypothetical protein
VVHLLIIIAVGAFFRFPGLGDLSLYGDEEHTMLAVQAILADGVPHMPSGMGYWRAVPYSYMATGSALIFGVNELAIRVPSAVLGLIALPVFYALARRHIGWLSGLMATWLLVCSAWHIDISREGRMYSAFLTFFLISLLWFEKGFIDKNPLYRILALVGAVLTVTSHELSILLMVFWCIPVFLGMYRLAYKEQVFILVVSLGLSIFWYGYQQFEAFVVPGVVQDQDVAQVSLLAKIQGALHLNFLPKFWMLSDVWDQHVLLFCGLAVSVILWLLTSYRFFARPEPISPWLYIVALLLSGFALFNLFGLVAVSVLLLGLTLGKELREIARLRFVQSLVVLLSMVLGFWVFYGITVWQGTGLNVFSQVDLVRKVLKDSLSYPALHILMYLEAFPVMTGVVMLTSVFWILTRHTGWGCFRREAPVFVWFWLPLVVLGLTREWIALRYTLPLYPFYLMIMAWGVARIAHFFAGWIQHGVLSRAYAAKPLAVPAVVSMTLLLLVVPLINEHHHVWAALKMGRLDYNQDIPQILHGYPYHPDHQGAGQYVKKHLHNDDVVIAMDVFEQAFYVGKVDYWLRVDEGMQQYSYQHNGEWFDKYTRSRLVTSPQGVDAILQQHKDKTIWLITSSENQKGLETLLPQHVVDCGCEVYLGRDKQTRVYRFSPHP